MRILSAYDAMQAGATQTDNRIHIMKLEAACEYQQQQQQKYVYLFVDAVEWLNVEPKVKK